MDRGLISLKFEGFFAKWPGEARSGPSARPIRRPRKASDVACFPARGLIQLKFEGFFEKKLREDKDDGLILLKLKVLFVNFLQPLRVDFEKS